MIPNPKTINQTKQQSEKCQLSALKTFQPQSVN